MIRLAALLAILILTGCTLAQQGAFDLESYGDGSTAKSFGSVEGGILDAAPTFQAQLNAIAACGGVLDIPSGVYRFGSTVYIPQRCLNTGPGIAIRGNNSTIVGDCIGGMTLFETGTGTCPTATNFGEPFESSTSVHYGTSISGFSFTQCGTAIKVYNLIQRSSIRDCWFYQATTAIHAYRCFYLDVTNNHAFLGTETRADTDPIFWFQNTANSMTVEGNSANGQWGSARRGIGFLWSQGAFGMHATNNAAEGCKTGVHIAGEVRGFSFTGGYLENNDTAIDLGAVGKWGLTIDACYWNTNDTAISGVNWGRGTFGNANQIDVGGGIISLGDPSNSMQMSYP